MSSAREPQLPLDTPDPLTCWPTAMTTAVAPLGGEAYLERRPFYFPCAFQSYFIYLEDAHGSWVNIFGA